MFESVVWYLKGYVRVRVTGASPERFLNACRYKNIYIWNLKRVHGAYEMNLTMDGFLRLKDIVRKTDTTVVIIRRSGLPFLLHKYRKRYLLTFGMFLCIILVLKMSGYIWSVDIKGNYSYTEETLKRFLASEDIKEGMKKKNVDCQKIVQGLRKKYEKIIWVSASVDGCRLVVEIKENEDGVSEDTKKEEKNTDIVALTDCTVIQVVTRSGVPVVHPGEQVKKGAVLISGQIPICNDAKEITGYKLCNSDADIIGETNIPYQKAISKIYDVKKYYLYKEQYVRKKEYGIRIGNYFCTIGQSRNRYTYFEQKTSQKSIRIVNVFPVIIEKTEIFPYRKKQKKYSMKEARRILSADFNRYCKEMEKKGVEIIQNDVKIYTGSGTYYAKGTLKIHCSVGKQVPGMPIPVPNNVQEKELKNGD